MAVAIAGLGLVAVAPVTLGAPLLTMSVNGTANTNGGVNSDSFGPTSDSNAVNGSASVISFGSLGTEQANAFAFGSDSGAYGAGSGGSAMNFLSVSHFHQTLVITNSTATANSYNLAFNIYAGALTATSETGSGDGYAAYQLYIAQNNGPGIIFSSTATLDDAGVLSHTGSVLDSAGLAGDTYSWMDTYVNLALGTLNAGDSMSIDYDLVTTAVGDYEYDECAHDIYAGTGITGTLNVNICSSSAILGDPGVVTGIPFAVSATPLVNDVPEPAMVSLVGAGLGALAIRRRRSKRRADGSA